MTDRARVAFITGGARGIGRAFADALVADGCNVVLADASPEAAASTCSSTTLPGT